MKISNRAVNDLIWMSMRYCVGRHTLAASAHAGGIAKIIADNPGALSQYDLTRLATDIRDEIIGILRWDPRFRIVGSAAGQDVYSELMYAIQTVDDPNSTVFEYDATYNVFRTYPLGDTNLERVKSRSQIDCDYGDLITWIKLANALDISMHKKLICEWVDDNGEKHPYEYVCFPYPARVMSNGKYRYFKAWAPVKETLGVGISHQSWVAEENIKEILDIE